MARHEEDFGFGLTEPIAVAVVDLDVDTGDPATVLAQADDGAAGRLLDLEVAADVVAVVVGVQDMGDLPAALLGLREDRSGHRGVDDAYGPALGFPHQPHVIVVQDRDTDDV